MEHAEVFKKLKTELEAAAKTAGVTLPVPGQRLVDDVNCIYIPVWEKENRSFLYLIEGTWTFDDVVRYNPNDMATMFFYTEGDISQLCSAMEKRYGKDPEIKLRGAVTRNSFKPATLVADVPARRVAELSEYYMINDMGLVEPTVSQKQKRKEFLIALVAGAHEKSHRDGFRHVKLQTLNHEEIFGGSKPTGFTEYHDFLGLLKTGQIIDENTCRNLVLRMG